MKETTPHKVLWALVCPFAGLLRHRSLTVRAFIGEIPVPVMVRKGNDWLMELPPLPSSKPLSGFQRAVETDANFVSALTSSEEFRDAGLGKNWASPLRISFLPFPPFGVNCEE